MKALILCAGYATRLYPLTRDRPKPLLAVKGKPVISHICDRINACPGIDLTYVVTNDKFKAHFERWRSNYQSRNEIRILSDGTDSEAAKLGAVGDLGFFLEREKVDDDLLVVAGDNLFKLDLKRFADHYRRHGPSVAVCDVADRELVKKYNEVRLDRDGRIVFLREKPSDPETTLAAICLYAFPRDISDHLRRYRAEGGSQDQPGRFIEWLYKTTDVFGFVFTEPWFDIGDQAQYERAEREYDG